MAYEKVSLWVKKLISNSQMEDDDSMHLRGWRQDGIAHKTAYISTMWKNFIMVSEILRFFFSRISLSNQTSMVYYKLTTASHVVWCSLKKQ